MVYEWHRFTHLEIPGSMDSWTTWTAWSSQGLVIEGDVSVIVGFTPLSSGHLGFSAADGMTWILFGCCCCWCATLETPCPLPAVLQHGGFFFGLFFPAVVVWMNTRTPSCCCCLDELSHAHFPYRLSYSSGASFGYFFVVWVEFFCGVSWIFLSRGFPTCSLLWIWRKSLCGTVGLGWTTAAKSEWSILTFQPLPTSIRLKPKQQKVL